jgi:hypothetical protein
VGCRRGESDAELKNKVAQEKGVWTGGDKDGWSRSVPRVGVGVVEVKMEADREDPAQLGACG